MTLSIGARLATLDHFIFNCFDELRRIAPEAVRLATSLFRHRLELGDSLEVFGTPRRAFDLNPTLPAGLSRSSRAP